MKTEEMVEYLEVQASYHCDEQSEWINALVAAWQRRECASELFLPELKKEIGREYFHASEADA